MSRVYNFSAGPAALPLEVLETIRNDIPDWQHTGMTVMEISHRSKEFIALAERAEANLRELLGIPGDYSVLFTQGGAIGLLLFSHLSAYRLAQVFFGLLNSRLLSISQIHRPLIPDLSLEALLDRDKECKVIEPVRCVSTELLVF